MFSWLRFAFLLLLCSCRLGSPYRPPCPPVQDSWKAPAIISCPTPDVDFWWEIFGDETLNSLEHQAVNQSPTLDIAFERVIQARSFIGVQRASLFPQITLDPSYSNSGSLFKIFLPKAPGIPPIPSVFRIHQQQFALPLDVSYQIDLWGKLQGQFEAAFYDAQAQADAYHVTLLTLTSDLATNYFQLRTLDADIDILRSTIETRRKNLTLNQSRFDKGLAANIDVTQASVLLSNAEADYYDAQRRRTLLENAIAILVGVPPAEICLSHNPLMGPPPAVPAGLPSEVLKQRPDLSEAERTMAAQHALIGVAYASFFPSLELTGSLGYLSPDFRHFLTWKSRYWAMGADISQSIFDAGRNINNLASAKSSYREAIANYQQKVLTAFREVEDALNNLEWQAKQGQTLEHAVEDAKKTLKFSNKRYQQGLVTYLEVVESERTELETEINASQVLGNRYISTVQLIKALGGAWCNNSSQ